MSDKVERKDAELAKAQSIERAKEGAITILGVASSLLGAPLAPAVSYFRKVREDQAERRTAKMVVTALSDASDEHKDQLREALQNSPEVMRVWKSCLEDLEEEKAWLYGALLREFSWLEDKDGERLTRFLRFAQDATSHELLALSDYLSHETVKQAVSGNRDHWPSTIKIFRQSSLSALLDRWAFLTGPGDATSALDSDGLGTLLRVSERARRERNSYNPVGP